MEPEPRPSENIPLVDRLLAMVDTAVPIEAGTPEHWPPFFAVLRLVAITLSKRRLSETSTMVIRGTGEKRRLTFDPISLELWLGP